ncbi:serpin family protein [Nocardia thailandica]
MAETKVPWAAASNRLTARWCAASEGDFVLSGAGLWPLLAALAPAATGTARAELAEAVGLPLDRAHAGARAVMAELQAAEGISGAFAAWFRGIVPRADWVAQLPGAAAGLLPDRAGRDAWAREHTGGLIPRFPLDVGPDTLLVLATALAARTTWATPFRPTRLVAGRGPWAGRPLPGLTRAVPDAGSVAVLHGPRPVTRVVVRGTGDLDVHVLLGDGPAGEVLASGLDALDGSCPAMPSPPPGTRAPGLDVVRERAPRPGDREQLTLPPFRLSSEHDLLAHAAAFGLRAAGGPGGHFPGVADTPLRVSQARQRVFAEFTAAGFSAAAVTAIGMVRAALRPDAHEIVVRRVTVDRPFSFLAVHRPSGAAVFAGHLAEAPADDDGRAPGGGTRPS